MGQSTDDLISEMFWIQEVTMGNELVGRGLC